MKYTRNEITIVFPASAEQIYCFQLGTIKFDIHNITYDILHMNVHQLISVDIMCIGDNKLTFTHCESKCARLIWIGALADYSYLFVT